jgi:hypothetical protein
MSEFDLIEHDEEVFDDLPTIDGEVKMVAPMSFVTNDYKPEETTEKIEEKPIAEKPIETEKPTETEKPIDVEKPIEAKVEEVKVEEKPIEVDYDPFEKLGLTDEQHKKYLEKFIDAVKTNSVNEFLAKTSVNYDDMSVEELLQYDITTKLKKEYPNASKKAIEMTIKKEMERIQDEYNITSADEEEVEIGMEMLKMKMDKVREELKAEQTSYAPPKYEAKALDADPAQIEAQKQMEQVRNEFVQYVEKSPELQEVERTKVVSFGDFKVDLPDGFNAKEQTIDVNKFLTPFFGADGKLNMSKWLKTIAIANDPDKHLQDAINYGKSLKEKERFDSLRGIDKGANDALDNNRSGEYVVTNVRHTSSRN